MMTQIVILAGLIFFVLAAIAPSVREVSIIGAIGMFWLAIFISRQTRRK